MALPQIDQEEGGMMTFIAKMVSFRLQLIFSLVLLT